MIFTKLHQVFCQLAFFTAQTQSNSIAFLKINVAEVVVGITDSGDSVLYDVVDMTPTAFDIKEAESSTAATTQNAIGAIHEDSAENSVSQDTDFVKHKFKEQGLSSSGDVNPRQEYNKALAPKNIIPLDLDAVNRKFSDRN